MATDVSAPLPDLTLEEKAVITVDSGDPGALISRIVVHVSQELPETTPVFADVPVVFAYEPTAGTG